MPSADSEALIRRVVAEGRYLILATTDGSRPWAATLEYLHDDRLNFYFFSTDDSLHARHIEQNPEVAFSIFVADQPDYSSTVTASLNGVQVGATAMRLAEDEHPEAVVEAIEALSIPMPPYSAFRLVPTSFHLPRIESGINVRVRIDGLVE